MRIWLRPLNSIANKNLIADLETREVERKSNMKIDEVSIETAACVLRHWQKISFERSKKLFISNLKVEGVPQSVINAVWEFVDETNEGYKPALEKRMMSLEDGTVSLDDTIENLLDDSFKLSMRMSEELQQVIAQALAETSDEDIEQMIKAKELKKNGF